MTDPGNDLLFSVASIGELAIKQGMRKPDFVADTAALREALLANGFQEIQVKGEHALAVRDMPLIHRDPLDRILIAQATVEQVTLVTSDRMVARYPGPIRHFRAPSGLD